MGEESPTFDEKHHDLPISGKQLPASAEQGNGGESPDFNMVMQEAADLLTQVQLASETLGVKLDTEQRLQACELLSTCLSLLNSWQQHQDYHVQQGMDDSGLSERVTAIKELLELPFDHLTDEHIIDAVDAACDALRRMCQIDVSDDETKSLARNSLRQVMKGVRLAREAREGRGYSDE